MHIIVRELASKPGSGEEAMVHGLWYAHLLH
jgi:hypothetical protein